MNIEEYGEEIWKLFPMKDLSLNVLGLCGEAGELANKVKKSGYTNITKEEIIEELADVLWHVSQCAKILEITITDLADISIKKTRKRNK